MNGRVERRRAMGGVRMKASSQARKKIRITSLKNARMTLTKPRTTKPRAIAPRTRIASSQRRSRGVSSIAGSFECSRRRCSKRS
jgi:hypothetical protein